MNRPDSRTVHLFQLDLDSGSIERAHAMLSNSELERAARFRFDLHRHRYVHGRAALRQLLGQYLGVEPRDIALRTLEFGKPVLDGALQFNLAHCEGLGLLAVGCDRDIGVDVEMPRTLTDREALASSNFSSEEQSAIAQTPEDQRERAFFRCWTRKEAFLKMSGVGIGTDLRKIHVGVADGSQTSVAATLHTSTLADGAIFSVASSRPWQRLTWMPGRAAQA